MICELSFSNMILIPEKSNLKSKLCKNEDSVKIINKLKSILKCNEIKKDTNNKKGKQNNKMKKENWFKDLQSICCQLNLASFQLRYFGDAIPLAERHAQRYHRTLWRCIFVGMFSNAQINVLVHFVIFVNGTNARMFAR